MFSIEVKTSQPWVLKSRELRADRWTVVGTAVSQTEAEKEISWLTLGFEDISLVKDLKLGLRIQKSGNVVWEQEKIYKRDLTSSPSRRFNT